MATWLTSLPVYPVCLPPTLLRAGAPWAWTQVNSLFPPASLIHQEEQTLPESTGKQENASERTLKLKLEQNPTQVPLGTFCLHLWSRSNRRNPSFNIQEKGKLSGIADKPKKKMKTLRCLQSAALSGCHLACHPRLSDAGSKWMREPSVSLVVGHYRQLMR